MEALFVFAIYIAIAALVAKFASRKGFSFGLHLFLALLFSPLLMAIVVAIRSPKPAEVERSAIENGSMKKCPACAELVKAEAIKCRYCGTAI